MRVNFGIPLEKKGREFFLYGCSSKPWVLVRKLQNIWIKAFV